ncbi:MULTISPECIES: energy-dependent translational throttle protein EttA [Aquimarina]|uniref:Energy-dependent translational throttle protein EttA n=1 Tax=Aquimarina algiphila TaxID=2047982 RepID=A0A554VHF4_9FLAO|nr:MULTISPECIES: energy-dependent translational throttle protein EttA [Aquimarina]TSE06911.1 energy-dependent translational throttle protein EttA [Aquimarina algiphila]
MSDDKKVIFSMSGVSKTYKSANTPVLKNIYLSFFYGAKIGILGLNGSGKSTLLKIIAGVDKNFQGDVVFASGYTVGFLEQEPQLDPEKTVLEVVKEGVAETVAVLDEYNKINDMFGLPEVYENPDKMQELMDKQANLQDQIDASNAWELDTKLEIAMDALRTPDSDKKISVLSGGERRRVALCRLLLKEPDVLLLDEPTNHLDAESVHWLEHHLQNYKGTVIAVTHDRYFLDNVAGWILELDRGEGIPWKGNYSSWLDQKAKKLAQEQKQASKRQKTLERELEWVRMAPKGRQAKQKARLSNYDKLLSQDQKQVDEKLEIYIPNGPRLGTNVIEASGVSKAFGDKLLYEDLNFNLPQAGIVGIIGPNGAGKTTIFKMIMGEEQPDKGSFNVGETASIAYVDQSHSNIDTEKTIWQNFSDEQELVMMGGRQVNSRAYLSRFNFSGSEQNKKVSTLSGGERNRLHLAMTLKEEGNVLLLDEPTNDLDVNTLRALEEGLENFAGCAVVISHDRWFLDRICTHILAFEGDSQVYFFEGSFSDYEENKKKRLGGDLMPKRIKYKKLVR